MNHRRLKSAHLDKEAKHFLALERELRALWRQKLNAPLVELDEPFIRGYERFFVLKESTRRRKDANQITKALAYFQNHEYCRKGWFRGGSPLRKRWKKGEVGSHHLRRPNLASLIKADFPDHLYRYVKVTCPRSTYMVPATRTLNREQLTRRARFQYPGLFESRTQPRLVTHLPLHDPALEARLDELYDILWGSYQQGKITKALHRRKWRDFDLPPIEKSIREDFRYQLDEANSDPSIQSAVSPRFFCALTQQLFQHTQSDLFLLGNLRSQTQKSTAGCRSHIGDNLLRHCTQVAGLGRSALFFKG